MTSTQPAQAVTEPAESPVEPSAPVVEGDHPQEQGDAEQAPGRYRMKLAAAEAERDTLRTRVESMQRGEVERLADLQAPTALWAAGTQLADLLDDNGMVDPAKVAAAVADARSALGLVSRMRHPQPDQSQGAHADRKPPAPEDSWGDFLKG